MARKQQRRDSTAPVALMILGSVVILGVVIWQTIRVLDRTAAQATPAPAAAEIPFPEVQRISLADAKAAYDSGTAVFVDVRDADSYAAAHIPDALNIVNSQIGNRTAELDREDHIITYCT